VIETSAHTMGFDTCRGEGVDDFLGYFWGAFIWVGLFVVVGWEAVETVRIIGSVWVQGWRKWGCTHRSVLYFQLC
jgi:hypothetical protein